MPQYQAQIPSMTCGNCVRHVEKAARSIPGVTVVHVDLVSKLVKVEGSFDEKALEAKLVEEGYPPVHPPVHQ